MAEVKKEQTTKVVKNASQGYGYSYSNLADLANAGIEIPQMRVQALVVDGKYIGDYVEYKDENGEWQRGAKIVVPDMKGMNAAQAYGSALTYARRYTVQMAMSVACDDDDKLENHDGAGRSKPAAKKTSGQGKLDFKEIWANVDAIDSVEELNKYWLSLKLTPAQENVLKKSFAKRKEELGQ